MLPWGERESREAPLGPEQGYNVLEKDEPTQSNATIPIHHLLRYRLARQPPLLQIQMRQLMHQIITLIPDQRIRLAHKDIIPHYGTIHILRPTRRENRLG